jgi:hypothetical protein
MSIRIKLLAVVLLLGAAAPIAASADEVGPVSTAELMCDYCGDYSDAATSSSVVHSAYMPVAGYALEPRDVAANSAATIPAIRINQFQIERK